MTVGVHTPEFEFEENIDNVRRAANEMRVDYPVAIDNRYAIWNAFSNEYWPAVYLIDAQGSIRYHHFGESAYEQSELLIQQLLADAGADGIGHEMVSVNDARGVAAPADWSSLKSQENYLGYRRTENFTPPGGIAMNERRVYATPARLTVTDHTFEIAFLDPGVQAHAFTFG